jgi:nickel-dependent lactate racemase
MDIRLAFGEQGLWIHVPEERTLVVEPAHHPGARDQMETLRDALRHPIAGPPLSELVRPGDTVAISMCDGTRAQPRQLMIPAVLEQIDGIVAPEDIVVLVATGTHRGNTAAEIEAMLGADLAARLQVINHDARDASSLVDLGVHGDGVPVSLNRRWVEADVRITTGFVEPHFFAGFSGGPKLVAPGLAGLETVLVLHDAARIGAAGATWGRRYGNPVHDDIRAAADAAAPHFAFDVILNRDQCVISAFAGELQPMHDAACEAAERFAMRPVPAPFDVVVTSNSGAPLDQNLYQSVKGMSAAANIVKPGGVIVCAAECRDGFPAHGAYRALLESAPSPREFLDRISTEKRATPDQWQVQIQARILERARVIMHTGFLSEDALRAVGLEHTGDVSATVARELAAAGPDATLCVLPEGPQTITYVAAE